MEIHVRYDIIYELNVVNIWQGKADSRLRLLDVYADSSGNPARLGRCQSNPEPTEWKNDFMKIRVFDDYPSRDSYSMGKVGILRTEFKEAGECSRNDYGNFYYYRYDGIWLPCENQYDESGAITHSIFSSCSKNRK